MNIIENKMREMIQELVQNAKSIEFRASINDTSYSMEFFVEVEGNRRQCYELVDEGIIDERELDSCFERMASLIRNSSEYKHGILNKISFSSEEHSIIKQTRETRSDEDGKQFFQGLKYLNPQDINNYNPPKGFKFYYDLLEQGYEYARSVVFMMLYYGIGVEKDVVEAEKHWEILRSQGLITEGSPISECKKQMDKSTLYSTVTQLANNLANKKREP